MPRTVSRTIALALSVLCTVVVAAPAQAADDRRRGAGFGVTTLQVTADLGALGLAAAPIRPAFAGAQGLAFPIATPLGFAKRSGRIVHTGGIVLRGGGAELRLTDFVIRLEHGDLTARVGGARVPILDLAIPAGTKLRPGAVGPVRATLTEEAAGALTATFGAPDLTGAELGLATVRY